MLVINGKEYTPTYMLTTEQKVTMLHALMDKALTVAEDLRDQGVISRTDCWVISDGYHMSRDLHLDYAHTDDTYMLNEMLAWQRGHII